ncbi:MAG: hypothetical protein KDA61_07070 [Planctomycetales bacterium]|nr:hypothetical protein [Planctomycetales bacterium]
MLDTTIHALPTLPFAYQIPVDGAVRTCAAAALHMAYGAAGVVADRAAIWRRLADSLTPAHAVVASRLTEDALAQGLPSLTLRCSEYPLAALATVMEAGWTAIVNHRLACDRPEGHYSVVAALSHGGVALHDPLRGPYRWLACEAFEQLWLDGTHSEISGGVLVACGGGVLPRAARPWIDELDSRSHIECPRCRQTVPLADELGAGTAAPWSRLWECVFCPTCDAAIRPPHAQRPRIHPAHVQPVQTQSTRRAGRMSIAGLQPTESAFGGYSPFAHTSLTQANCEAWQ